MRFLTRIQAKVGNQLLILVHIWMAYILLSKLALNFSHWKIPFISLINYDLFFLIMLLSLAVFIKGENNRYVYLNLAIFAFGYLLGFLTIFFGEDYSIGNDYLQYLIWTYRKIMISIITCVTVIYIPIDYLYHEKKISVKYLVTLLITVPVSFIYFRNFLLSYRYLFIDNNFLKIFSSILGMNFLAIFFILLYGYLFIYRFKPISGHVNLVVFGFLIFLAIDSLDNFYNSINKPLPPLSQIILTVNLILFVLMLLDNFLYLGTEFGKFYEKYRFSKIKLTIRLIPRKTFVEKYVIFFQQYFKSLPYKIMLISLMAISLSFFLHLYPYGYSKLSFLILIFLTIAIIAYLNILIRKRTTLEVSKKNN